MTIVSASLLESYCQALRFQMRRLYAREPDRLEAPPGFDALGALLSHHWVDEDDQAYGRIESRYRRLSGSNEFGWTIAVYESSRSLFLLDRANAPGFVCIPKRKWQAFVAAHWEAD